jgi:RimJ/RimL family protein N-acetyltransferase
VEPAVAAVRGVPGDRPWRYELKVRSATRDDAVAIAEIVAEVAGEGTLGVEPPVDVGARAERYVERIEAGAPEAFWVLEDGGRVVGNADWHQTTRGVLQLAMVILPGARGRGGGKALLQAALDHALTSGAHKVDLEVWTDNARAIALYASFGFQVEGVRRDHYRRRDGSLRSTIVMAKHLGAPETRA